MSRDYVLQPFQSEVHLQIDYARELNEQQCAAVTAPPGPALVIAGAGSGKTRTLTYRVAYLLEQGIPADRILLLTFTNKAAGEMMRRVAELVGRELPALWGGTFHSIGARVLRTHAEVLGYRRNFTILDRDDAKELIKACVTDEGIPTKETHFPKPDVLNEIFSLAVNTHKSVEATLQEQFEYLLERYEGESDLAEDVVRLSQLYAKRKRVTNAMDFDDLLALWLKLLQEHADVREQYQRRFQFILVDEYQDTNRLQGDLIDMLAARHGNVMVVGDDAQSIYAWRGANFQNILKFPDRYPGAKVFKIETNYRSTPEILGVANAAIAANLNQFPKNLTPARPSGLQPAHVVCIDPAQQAAFIAKRVLELRDDGVGMNQMAVLYRSHFHALDLQMELVKWQVPFSITSGLRFFEQAHFKDATAYLKLIVNPRDEVAFKRLAQLLPGIAAKGADKLWNIFTSALAGQTVPSNPVATALTACAPRVGKRAAGSWAQFVATVAQLGDEIIRKSPTNMLRLVLDAGYDDYLKENYDNHERRLTELHQLAEFAAQFASVEDFLTQLVLLTNVEAEDDPDGPDNEKIRLSTIHQAKGLEFEVVFVIMLCDGLFPFGRSMEDEDGLEEERRLFYVAITRAKNELYLCHPTQRTKFTDGGCFIEDMWPSRFLSEIPKELLEEWKLRSAY